MKNDTTTDQDSLPAIQPYSDRELDDAMRELLAIEAAERDRQVLLEVWRQRNTPRRGLASRLAAWLTAGAVLCMSSAALAQDSPKPKRPTMCLKGQPVSGDGFVGYICLDGKKPRIFTRFIEVRFVDENGKPASYVLGWTAPVKRTAKGGYVAEGTPSKPPSGTLKL